MGYYKPKYEHVHRKDIWSLDYEKYHVKDIPEKEIFIYGSKDGCDEFLER